MFIKIIGDGAGEKRTGMEPFIIGAMIAGAAGKTYMEGEAINKQEEALELKRKQAEAKALLKQMFTMQRAYRQANDSYWGQGLTADSLVANQNNFATIGVKVPDGARYQFGITVANGTNLTMTATATALDDDPAPDIWQMDQDGVLTCTSDDVTL